MTVHFVRNLGQEEAIEPFAPATPVCGNALREAHEVVRPDSDRDVCPACLSWSRRNKYQSFACVVEMSAAAKEALGGERVEVAGGK
jgi:hypothetical protein